MRMAGLRQSHRALSQPANICIRALFRTSDSEKLRSYSSSLKQFPLRQSPGNNEQRTLLSRIWAPTGGIAVNEEEDAYMKLVRAGFVRQAHSGIFHLLPLGLRVQDKIAKLVDKHMSTLGASRLDLSSISSEGLWSQSGRLSSVNSELFRFKDRKGTAYLLSPTHEEEITSLVSNSVKSYKDLPIPRKYRDELRPRHGLLRSREFVMKDLYTFDCDLKLALETYEEVRSVYATLFDELKIPYLIAEADSGNMGGNLSHEFHFPTPTGEDHIISCDSCSYVANEELAESLDSLNEEDESTDWSFANSHQPQNPGGAIFGVWRGISRDRTTLINVWYPLSDKSAVNTHAVKNLMPDLDAGVENVPFLWAEVASAMANSAGQQDSTDSRLRIVNLVDRRLPASVVNRIVSKESSLPLLPSSPDLPRCNFAISSIVEHGLSGQRLDLMRISNGDRCPRCAHGSLNVQKAIELGHTFFLGTRYSDPLAARVSLPGAYSQDKPVSDSKHEDRGTLEDRSSAFVPIQMGCHGIGVSRLIGAVADTLADTKGLNWPRVIAPYEVVIVPVKGLEDEATSVYDYLIPVGPTDARIDTILDDRTRPFAWKMHDADLVGYPVIIIVGKDWKDGKCCEVQCRRMNVKESVPLSNLKLFVENVLAQL